MEDRTLKDQRFRKEEKSTGKHNNSLKLQRVPIDRFSQAFDDRFKDITKLDDFNQLADWGNNSFYKQVLITQIIA